MDWDAIITTLGSTAIAVAFLGFLGRSIVRHFLNLDLERHRDRLNKENVRLQNELRQKADLMQLEQKNLFEQRMATFRAELESRSANADRIRDEVLRWANPILAAVEDLQDRLDNILSGSGYPLLSRNSPVAGWSAQYEYFLPSTVFLFCQYFCWTRRLEQELSFELFGRHEVKDRFFEPLRKARRCLSRWPMLELADLSEQSDDRQVFKLEQRALGEIVALKDSKFRCMGYAEFLDNWDAPTFKKRLNPMIIFLEGLNPQAHRCRWRRLERMSKELEALRAECRRLLDIP